MTSFDPLGTGPVEHWREATESLRGRAGVPAAQASAKLLDTGRAKWSATVVAHSSMHDLIFSRLTDPYPWQVQVRVSWEAGVYDFRLLEGQGNILVSADRCFEGNAPAVLDAFLYQLAGRLAPDPADDGDQPSSE